MRRFKVETIYCIAAMMRLLYVIFMTAVSQMVTSFKVQQQSKAQIPFAFMRSFDGALVGSRLAG
ncbi:hypothetical protein UNDKW_1446 [Undibacterium sp. KW1]|nr:hypothetical protein UNDKW_1446 [Undibacterium sp. KW1]